MVYLAHLWKSDFGGHTKSFSRNVDILGPSCGCGNDEGSPHTPSWDPRYNPTIGNDSFVGNRCIGMPSEVTKCTDSKTHATIRDNLYYVHNHSGTSDVCPPGTGSPIEAGSKTMPFPTVPEIVAMAEDALRMAP